MNPTATLRFRRATALLAVLWALLGLGLSVRTALLEGERWHPAVHVSAFAGDPWRVLRASPHAERAGVRAGDHLLAVDGAPPDLAFLRWPFRPGTTSLYRIAATDGAVREIALAPATRREIAPPLAGVAALLVPLVALVYLVTGIAVWWLRGGQADAWALLLFCSVLAADLFVVPPAVGGLAYALSWLSLPLIGATLLHLFTTHPLEPEWLVRRRWLRPAAYAIAVALGAGAMTEGVLGAPAGLLKAAAFYFTIGTSVACFVIMGRERRRLREPGLAARADVMFYGGLVSFAPVLVLLVAQSLFQTSWPWSLALAWFVVFPVAVGYGIARRQLFEIRSVAKSSVAYGAASVAITGLYASLITFADAVVSRFNVNARSPWFSVGFLFFAVLAFNPLRNRLQRIVDRVFDRDRSLYREAVREISEAMVSMLSTKEIVDRILLAVTDTMGVERALVMLLDPRGERLRVVASRGEWDGEALGLELRLDHPLCQRLRAARRELSRADFDDEPDPDLREAGWDVFDALDVELLVPIVFGDELLGVIAVGEKLSGERLVWDDRQLLRTLANQSSSAIENARAFDEIARLTESLEARVEQRTRELREAQAQLVHSEKMRSLGQLVAGVAHELNNPIGFVHANLQLLQEFVGKLEIAQARGEDTTRYREAIEKLLSRSREGTERVKKIVQDLRTFSRMDRADLAEVDLNREIDKTLALLEPRLKDRITVERDYGELPPVRCYAGQLSQVFLNLLMNAADALGEHGTIRIRTRRVGDRVRLEFEDDGPGIAPEILDRIFEPFFTTKEVGKGTGLGLSVSHGIVERHGGRMLVGSSPGQGTTFVVELPLDATPQDA